MGEHSRSCSLLSFSWRSVSASRSLRAFCWVFLRCPLASMASSPLLSTPRIACSFSRRWRCSFCRCWAGAAQTARGELGLHVSILGHGALGIAWLFLAFVNGPMGPFSFEPFIVALFGWAVLSHGIRSEDATDANVGLAFLVAYVPFHLWAAAWSSSVPILLLAALLVLLAARFVPIPILEKPVARFILFWRAAAVVAALTMTGTEMLALAVGHHTDGAGRFCRQGAVSRRSSRRRAHARLGRGCFQRASSRSRSSKPPQLPFHLPRRWLSPGYCS